MCSLKSLKVNSKKKVYWNPYFHVIIFGRHDLQRLAGGFMAESIQTESWWAVGFPMTDFGDEKQTIMFMLPRIFIGKLVCLGSQRAEE